MRTSLRWIGLLGMGVLWASGCGGGGGSGGSGGTAGEGGSGGVGGTGGGGGAFDGVVLELTDTYRTENGEVTKIRDLGIYTSVEARILLDGASQTFPGALSADGKRFEIPGVPEGPYWLAFTVPPPAGSMNGWPRLELFRLEARTVDIGRIFAGRPDVVGGQQEFDAAITADGLANWQQDTHVDGLEFYSYNADADALISPDASVPGMPGEGGTAFSNYAFPWLISAYPASRDGDVRPLVDATKGDILQVTHLVDSLVPNAANYDIPWSTAHVLSARASFSTSSVTMKDGQPASITGTFQPLAQSTFDIDYKGNAFLAELEQNGPATPQSASVSLGIHQEPGGDIAIYGNIPELVSMLVTSQEVPVDPACFPSGGGGTCDPVACPNGCNLTTKLAMPGDYAGTFSYGNPYTHGTPHARMTFNFNSRVQHPIEGTTERLNGYFVLSRPLSDAVDKPFTPLFGLPRNVKLDGKTLPVAQPTTAIGMTPTVTWDPPATGTPHHYRVVVVLLDDVTNPMGYLSPRTSVLVAKTTETSFVIPAGVLQAGRYYHVQVSALVGDPFEKPFQPSAGTLAVAQTYTGIFTP
ncbi:hypothetical protein [Polyangium jinanense]|uniref:Fibronectin type-III domain-containing protein n=1 Tax=Polyangium jinanense TaxID=2829994 RepID=A0A9X3XCJ8_9BACT|nr:hypothetical protein [Polyangium jinanense]MDC3961855.1 hypothetical protein [Polyangium jinanense]MDC3987827.1 hypothetical protein [Polyangium jinanense]